MRARTAFLVFVVAPVQAFPYLYVPYDDDLPGHPVQGKQQLQGTRW